VTQEIPVIKDEATLQGKLVHLYVVPKFLELFVTWRHMKLSS